MLNIRSPKRQYLALESVLSHPSLVNQGADYDYFWENNEKITMRFDKNETTKEYII